MSAGAQQKRKQSGDTERSSHQAAAHMGRGEEGKGGRVSYRIDYSNLDFGRGRDLSTLFSPPSLQKCFSKYRLSCLFQNQAGLAFLSWSTPLSWAISPLVSFVSAVFPTRANTHMLRLFVVSVIQLWIGWHSPLKVSSWKSQECRAPPRHTYVVQTYTNTHTTGMFAPTCTYTKWPSWLQEAGQSPIDSIVCNGHTFNHKNRAENYRAAQVLDPSLSLPLWCHEFFLPFHSKALIHKWPSYHTVLGEKEEKQKERQRKE